MDAIDEIGRMFVSSATSCNRQRVLRSDLSKNDYSNSHQELQKYGNGISDFKAFVLYSH